MLKNITYHLLSTVPLRRHFWALGCWLESSALNRNLTTSPGLPCLVHAPDTSPLGHCSRLPSSLCAPVCSPKVCSQPGRSWDSAEIPCKSGLILPFCPTSLLSLHSGSGPWLLLAQMSGSPLGSSSGSRSYNAGFLVALWCLQGDGESQRGEAGGGRGRGPVLRSSRHCLHGLTCGSLRSPCPKQASSLGSSCGPRSLPEPRDFLKGRKTGRNVYKKHPNKMLTRRKVW